MAIFEPDGTVHHLGLKKGDVGRYVLLPGDRRGWAADTGGGASDRHAIKLTDPGGVLALLRDKAWVIKALGNYLNTTGVARQ